MSQLGSVQIWLKKGAKIHGVILVDDNQKPIGGIGINAIRPADGDWIQVEFLERPE